MGKKKQKTTRDTTFNWKEEQISVDKNKMVTLSNYTATTKNRDIRLMGAEDGMSVSGSKIINHALIENETLKKKVDVNKYVTNEDYWIKSGDNNTYRIYGAPFKSVLINRQNYNDCGVASTINTLAMAGLVKMKENLSDQKSTEKKFLKNVWDLGLVNDDGVIGKLDTADGGTEPDDYRDILRLYNIDSEAYYPTVKCDGTQFSNMNELAYKISQGYGAIVGVCADHLWQKTSPEEKIDHAIAILGVVYNENTKPAIVDDDGEIIGYNTPLGFYIQDTGAWMTRYISLEEFKYVTLYKEHGMTYEDYEEYIDYDEEHPLTKEEFETLYKPELYNETIRNYDSGIREYLGKKPNGIFVTITTEPIKNDMFNLKATGDKQNNNIWGNSGNNVIKGMAGNDVLYGNAGDDEIRGGNGKDVIIGNNLYADTKLLLNALYDFNLDALVEPTTSLVEQKGINKLYGDAGDDRIIGGNDIDLIYGGAGADYIYTGDGRNAVYGGSGKDTIVGGWENDRLFGEAGNDIIYGYGDNDTIHGGSGDDIIFGGRGNDRIETGSGKDTICFEGTEHGIDTITSQSGATTFAFIDETFSYVENGSVKTETIGESAKISNMYFSMERDNENNNMCGIEIAYEADMDNATDGIVFNNFYNMKKNSAKTLTIVDGNNAQYKVGATNKANAKVLSTTDNNVLFTTNVTGNNVTTSDKNDIVYMMDAMDVNDTRDLLRKDTITYTGGEDRYHSLAGDTTYTVSNFTSTTNLSIYDNVDLLEKAVAPLAPTKVKASEDDAIIFSDKASTNLTLLFDITNDGKVSSNTTMYILNGTQNVADQLVKGIVESKGTIGGSIGLHDFLQEGQSFDNTPDIYGNGRVEKFTMTDSSNYNYGAKIDSIRQDVATWFTTYEGECTTVFDVINTKDAGYEQLIACYTGTQA